MAIKLFTDTQKAALANEAGVPATQDSFNRDINPATGEATMYMKLGNNQKFYGANPTKVQTTPIQMQAIQMQDKFANQPIDQAYNAYISAIPASKQTMYDDIGMKTGIYSELEAITNQQLSLTRAMMGDQSAIFNAVNPDGTPVDPRVKVAQYKANMQSSIDRVDQLRQLETVYKSQLKVLGDAAYDKAQKEAETAKTALLYLKDLQDQENQNKDLQFKYAQLGQQNDQFKQEQDYKYAALGKPELKQNEDGSYDWITPPTPGQWMRTDRHANPTAFTTDIAKQAGLKEGVDYTVWDAFGDKGQYHTAKLLGDPIETTIKVIDKIGFKTQTGATRWAYTDKMGLNNETWSKMDVNQKTEAIKKMYKEGEGGSGSLFGDNKGTVTPSGVQGKVAKKDQMTYEEALKEFGKQAAANKSTDINGIVDSIASEYPTKKKEDIMKDFGNVATPELKKAIQDEQVKKEANLLKENLSDLEDDKSTTDYIKHLKDKLETNESVFKVFLDAGFFDKYKSGYIYDDSQYNAMQDFVENNGYDLAKSIKEGKLTK